MSLANFAGKRGQRQNAQSPEVPFIIHYMRDAEGALDIIANIAPDSKSHLAHRRYCLKSLSH